MDLDGLSPVSWLRVPRNRKNDDEHSITVKNTWLGTDIDRWCLPRNRKNDDVYSRTIKNTWSGTDIDRRYLSLKRKNDDRVSMTIENTWSGTDIDRWQRRDTSQRRMSVVFSNKIKIQGDWDFDLAKIGKLHFTIDEDGKRVPMSLKYEQAREKRIQRQVFNRWRHYKRPKVTIKLDPTDIPLLMDDKS